MIERHVASQQIDRLSGLDYFPRNDVVAYREMVVALQSSGSEFIAQYVVDEWLKTETTTPKPAQLRAAAWVENDKRDKRAEHPERDCPICNGIGMVIVNGEFSKLDKRQDTGAKDCECRAELIRVAREKHEARGRK